MYSDQIRTKGINELLEIDLPIVVLVTLFEDLIHFIRDVMRTSSLDLVLLQDEVDLVLVHISIPIFVDHIEHIPDILLWFYHLFVDCTRNELIVVEETILISFHEI